MTAAFHFFDNASTTACLPEAAELVRHFSVEAYGHPSSTHALGQAAARAIREARLFFSEVFQITPEQVIFTGSGTEADNLAIYGVALPAIASRAATPRVLASATEHPAVKKTVLSLGDFGIDAQLVPVDSQGQLDLAQLHELSKVSSLLISIHQVNNITGALLPIEDLAREVKRHSPQTVFHTDAVQSFGKVRVPASPSPVDLISISSHKIAGPKGVGALIVLNEKLLSSRRFRPLLWGGEQEAGWRSGTQNAGLIAGFHLAAERALNEMTRTRDHVSSLRRRLRERLIAPPLHWNSPDSAIPHIVNLSVPGFSAGPLARLLEERGYLVATGSACSSKKPEPDPTLSAMGLSPAICTSALRISVSPSNQISEVDGLVTALMESIETMRRLGASTPR